MARKSKGRFKLPTSTFKMESPLRQAEDPQMEFAEIETPEITRNMSLEQGDEESGWQYLTRQLGIRQALKNKKKKTQETDPSKNQEDQTNKYDGGEGTYEEYVVNMKAAGTEPMSLADWSELNSQNVDPDIGKGYVDEDIEIYKAKQDPSTFPKGFKEPDLSKKRKHSGPHSDDIGKYYLVDGKKKYYSYNKNK